MDALGLDSKHRRSPTVDFSPLAKSVTAFSSDALADSHVLHESQGAASTQPHGAPAPDGERIPAKHAPPPLPHSEPSLRQHGTGAPAGSVWNPWHWQSAAPALPSRRAVAHKPNPSWFAPIIGFGGPPSLVWEQQQRQEEALRQAREERQPRPQPGQQPQQPQAQRECQQPSWGPRGQQQWRQGSEEVRPQHQFQQQGTGGAAVQPPLESRTVLVVVAPDLAYAGPLAFEVAKLQQSLPPLPAEPSWSQPLEWHASQQQQLQLQCSSPWHTQGWQPAQQPASDHQMHSRPPSASTQAAAGLYPGGNPFASEAVQLDSARGTDAAAPAHATPHHRQMLPAASSSREAATAGGSGRRKLPPPPRFLLAHRSSKQGEGWAQHTQRQQPVPADEGICRHEGQQSHPAAPAPAAMAPQVVSGRSCWAAEAAEDVVAVYQAASLQCISPPQPQVQQDQQRPIVSALLRQPVEATPARAAASQPPDGPPPPPHAAVLSATAPPPPPSKPAAAAPPPKAPPPPPLLPPKPAGAPPAAAAPLPPPPPPEVAGKVPAAPPPAARLPAPALVAGPAAASGGRLLSAVKPAELLAMAGKLRKMGGAGGSAASSAATGREVSKSAAAAAAPVPQPEAVACDPRAQLMAAIKTGAFKLRSVEERKKLEAPAAAGMPLGAPTASMADLLRRVVEQRRMAVSDDESDSEWGTF